MSKPTESIYNGKSAIIPLADVQHVERGTYGMQVVTDKTKWNFENDTWENAIFVCKSEEEAFLSAWRRYRSEVDGVQRGEESEGNHA